MSLYIDLKMAADDTLAVDADGLPLLVADRESIAQDLVHLIRESGDLERMIAERDPELRQLHEQRIARLVDEDVRIVPGTAAMSRSGEHWNLTAITTDFGPVEIAL